MSPAGQEGSAGRRQTQVLRNLDEPLKFLGLLTAESCGVVILTAASCEVLDLVSGLWSWIFGGWALIGTLGVALLAAAVLACVERQEDQHYVPSAVRYYLARPWTFVYSGLQADDFHGPDTVVRSRR